MLFSILILIVLIFINGVFSSTEVAFLSVDKIDLKEKADKGDIKATKIRNILQDPSSFLSTIQIGITLAGFLASAFAADYFAEYLLNIINISFISESILRTILVTLITLVLSYFTLVFGELVPKKIGINNPYKVASRYVGLIIVVKKIFNPLIKLLTISTEGMCKLLKIKDDDKKLTEEDIKKMILAGQDEGIIEEYEKNYILNVFQFNDINAEKVMTPRDQVCLVNYDDDLKEVVKVIKKTKFSRFPVYKGNEDNIVGVLNVKDLIIEHRDRSNFKIKRIIRKVSKFNYDEKIDDIFRIMQEKNESLSVVYKEDKLVGIITIEDAVEEIVGNISDDFN